MSKALTKWRGPRAVRLDRLAAAHDVVRRASTGVHSEYLNWSLLLTLASEFQAFARELHDLGVNAFVASTAPGNERLARVVRARLAGDRALARGNPTPEALAQDFGRLGLSLWVTLGPAAKPWRASLTTMFEARNAVAHGDDARLAAVRAKGVGLSVKTIAAWRADLDALAGAMDACVAKHHATLFGTPSPW
ncbi:MAG TPA: hypothetical protein VGX28_14460 [Frankiaceae bacterium]|jgi:hypothetical protein|nr:hypothetical protein [Frankiaceae bacterium]